MELILPVETLPIPRFDWLYTGREASVLRADGCVDERSTQGASLNNSYAQRAQTMRHKVVALALLSYYAEQSLHARRERYEKVYKQGVCRWFFASSPHLPHWHALLLSLSFSFSSYLQPQGESSISRAATLMHSTWLTPSSLPSVVSR